MKHRGTIAGFVWGTLYVLLFSYFIMLGEKYSLEAFQFVSIAMLIIMPVSVGVITVFFASAEQANNKKYRYFYPWFPVLGWSVISLILAWETIICIVMLLPLYMPLATLGGIIGGYVRNNFCDKTNRGVVSCFALLPLIIAPIELPIDTPTIRHAEVDSIIINAPVSKVWKSLPDIKNIKKTELPWTLSHAIGIPRPVSATTQNIEVGGIRELYWEKNVHFQEKITQLNKNELFAYDVLVDEESMKIAELDTHIVVGDKYFDVESGSYSLSNENGRTRLTLTTSYRMTSKINWYGQLWANFVLDDFHNSVLTLIKNRNE